MNRSVCLRWSGALLFGLPLPAQDPAWRLPARGAVEYSRTLRATSDVAATRAAADKLAATDALPKSLLPHLLPTSWLCQGELAADQRSVGDEPRDLRDLLRAVAFDLRLQRSVRLRFLRLVPFRDLVLTGRVADPTADGAQDFTLEVTTDDPEGRPGESKADLQQFVRPLCKWSASGTLRVQRVFDATQGVVSSFDAQLTLLFEEQKNTWRKLVITDAWQLVAVHDNQAAEFRSRVAAAIRSGAKWIKSDLAGLDRAHFKDQANRLRSYGAGRIALALLTLLHAEVPKNDPVIVAAFAELRRREFVDTYSLGVALMAMAEFYTQPGEADLLRSGALKAPRPRVLSDEDKVLAAEWLAKMRQNIDTRGDPGYRLRFNYVSGRRFDNSVNQYGVLGLYAAELCQLDVPVSVWRAAANALLEVQRDANGRDLRLELTTYRELANAVADGDQRRTRATMAAVPTRGFAYQGPERPAYGSMTTAGIGSLVIARAGMVRANLERADVMPKVDDAIRSGFAWLGAEFHVRSNPGYIDRADDNWYYYLYGLERTCELAGVALVQGRDWYFEGALQLLPQQARSGSFRPEREQGYTLDATCFAVLFLKKAALPATTGD